MYASSEGSGESAHMCADSPEHTLFDNAISNRAQINKTSGKRMLRKSPLEYGDQNGIKSVCADEKRVSSWLH